MDTIMIRAMTNRNRCVLFTRRTWTHAALGATLVICSGCATSQRDLLADGVVRVEAPPSETTSLSRVRVYEDGDDWIVYGQLGRKAGVKGRIDAIVHVIVSSPGGRTLEVTTRASPAHLPVRRSRHSNFSVRLLGRPPPRAVIRIERPPISEARTTSTAPSAQFE